MFDFAKLDKFINRFDARHAFYHRINDGAKILELGCGNGDNYRAIKLLHTDVEFYGVDILPPETVDKNINYQQNNLENTSLPFPDEVFDIILFIHVIEHLNNPIQLGKEINRVLKPQGLVYIEAPNWISMLIPSFGIQRNQHNPFNFFDDPSHVKPYTKQSLYEYLYQSCILKVKKIGTKRNLIKLPFDFIKLFYGILVRDRHKVISSVWNFSGWCIYGIGEKKSQTPSSV